jgi:hypothetical protein
MQFDREQMRLDDRSLTFKPIRDTEPFTQRFHGFIDHETRGVSGDFE